MLKYIPVVCAIFTLILSLFAYVGSSPEQFTYYVVGALVFGAITCILLTVKMMSSNTDKIDPSKHSMSDYGGGGFG